MECYKEERRMKEYKSRIPYEHDNIPGIRVTLNLCMPLKRGEKEEIKKICKQRRRKE